jgi:Uma2 family endonuclease
LASDSSAFVDDEGYIQGAPDLVVEIAASSASYDLHVKKAAYERSGVKEYVVWRTWDRAVDWFQLEDGKYHRVAPEDGLIESAVFPGLILDVDALLSGDRTRLLARVGLQLPDAGGQPGESGTPHPSEQAPRATG